MSTQSINSLIAEFDKEALAAKDRLTSVLTVVSKGMVPSKEEMTALDTVVFALQEKYHYICEVTQSLVSEDEMPQENSPVSSYAAAVEKNQAQILKMHIANIKAILEKFVCVKSLVSAYSEALAPFQAEATEVLQQLTTITADNIGNMLSAVEAPSAFIDVLDFDNINAPEGIRLLEKVSQYYPMQVQWGLVGRQYFVNECNVEVNLQPSSEQHDAVLATSVDENQIVPRLENHTDEIFINSTAQSTDSESDNMDGESEPPVENNNFICAKNKIKTSTPSASAFRKDVISMSRANPSIRAILPLMTNLGALTLDQIILFGGYMNCFDNNDESKANVGKALDALSSKGLLTIYEYLEGENALMVYCLSPYCNSCMRKDSIASQMKSFWNISFGTHIIVGDAKISATCLANAIENNSLLLKYLYYAKSTTSSSEFSAITSSIKWDGEKYSAIVAYNNERFTSTLADSDADTHENQSKNILIVANDNGYSWDSDGTHDHVFVLKNDTLILYGSDGTLSNNEAVDSSVLSNNAVEQSEPDNDTVEDSEQSVEEPVATQSVPIASAPVVEENKAQLNSPEMKTASTAPTISIASLVESKCAPTDDDFIEVIHSVLNTTISSAEELNDSVVNAVLLADGASLVPGCKKSKALSDELQLATGLFIREHAYTSECLAAAFAEPVSDDSCIMLASYLHALLTPSTAYDYGLKNQADMFWANFDEYFCGLQNFKTLFNKVMSVREVSPLGFSPAIIALLGSEIENEHFMADMRISASSNLIVKSPKTRMKALPVMYNACFGLGSDLYECMKIIAENRVEDVEYVEATLSEYCDEQNGIYSLSMIKVEAKLDSAWYSANSKSSFKLEYDARDQALRQYNNRLSVMLTWVEHISSSQSKTIDAKRLGILRNEITSLIQQVEKETSWRGMKNANILAWALPHLIQYLHGKFSMLSVFSSLLYTGVFSVSNDGIPDIDRSLTSVKYYEPWRNAIRHISTKKRSLPDIRAEIVNDDLGDESGLVDNLHQLEMLGKLLSEDSDEYSITATQIKEATDSAEARTVRFKEALELAYTYNQINETEKETLLGLMTQYKAVFFESKDFACWRRFLEALEAQIHEFADARMKPLRAKLDSRLSKAPDSPLLNEANRLLEHDKNFAVTEEYINRFDVGETDLADELDVILHDFDYFSDFLSNSVFDPLLAECRRCNGRAMKSFGWTYLDKRLPREWTARLREDSEKMVSNWPVRKDTSTPAQIQALFSQLGFSVNSASKVQGHKEEMFRLDINASPRSMADYRHPIASFGTQMKSPLNVIILYGNYTERQLVDTVSSFDLGGVSIVLIDRPLDKSVRRLIGEIFHTQTSGQNPFLLIDQVLFMYLAMHQITERIPALLKCTLPYTTYQPFVRDGGSTADEMFCGRTQELATIIDPNGACVVYGGRQLGKTALLERAESRCSKPDDKAFAVYTNIINCKTEDALVDKIIGDVLKKTGLQLSPCKSIDKLCAQIDRLFREHKIVSLLLLLDEADNFLASIADAEYKPIQPLIDLKRETKNSFKFVLAGLHNVCRAKNATAKNGVFGQLGTPLCVKPLTPTDALQLLSRPLRYLGFQIDRYPHLETILTNTNYYPGILQFFGYMLVETLSGQYAKYYHAADGNPPFTLQDEQLAAVMTSSDLNRSIRDKFRWSLELDQRYFMIARCITMLYHFHEDDRSSGSWLGFSVDEIINMAREYNIHCLENETHNSYINLMDEMVEMGILNQPDTGVYRLRRNSFVDIIGENFDTLDAEIISCNEEA